MSGCKLGTLQGEGRGFATIITFVSHFSVDGEYGGGGSPDAYRVDPTRIGPHPQENQPIPPFFVAYLLHTPHLLGMIAPKERCRQFFFTVAFHPDGNPAFGRTDLFAGQPGRGGDRIAAPRPAATLHPGNGLTLPGSGAARGRLCLADGSGEIKTSAAIRICLISFPPGPGRTRRPGG